MLHTKVFLLLLCMSYHHTLYSSFLLKNISGWRLRAKLAHASAHEKE